MSHDVTQNTTREPGAVWHKHATVCGMPRDRISTTVDRERLALCRRLVGTNDSALIDRALAALLNELEAEREQQALDELPYEADTELAWEVPGGPDLPYEGEIPLDVKRLAAKRRRQQARA